MYLHGQFERLRTQVPRVVRVGVKTIVGTEGMTYEEITDGIEEHDETAKALEAQGGDAAKYSAPPHRNLADALAADLP